MLRCVDHNRVARHSLDAAFLKRWEQGYVRALRELKSQIKEEEERATDIVGRGGGGGGGGSSRGRRRSRGKEKRKRREHSGSASKKSRKWGM